MPNYQQGKIYCIRSHQTEQIYIGSTTQTLAQRMAKHKNITNGCRSEQILEYQDAYIELIELFPCNSKEELNKKEGEHIRIKNCVNKNIPCRTEKERYQDIKEKKKEQMKEYRERPDAKEKRKAYKLKKRIQKRIESEAPNNH